METAPGRIVRGLQGARTPRGQGELLVAFGGLPERGQLNCSFPSGSLNEDCER
jgi:hypothetical protein